MSTDWRKLARTVSLKLDGDEMTVELAASRRHVVRVTDEGDHLRLWGIVATPSRIEDLPRETSRAWEHNRRDSLVGFRFDNRDRLVGECLVPVAGLTADEFEVYARAVAVECDRYEYLLTGRDIY